MALGLLAGIVLAATSAFSFFASQNQKQTNRAKATALLDQVANDIRANFRRRKNETSPVPNPQVNLTALPAPEMGTATAPAPPCVPQANGPVCINLQITQEVTGPPLATTSVSYQTKCDGQPIPPAVLITNVHSALSPSRCPSAPQITIDRGGILTTYPGINSLDVVAMAVCFRCYDKGNSAYEYVAEMAAAYTDQKKEWTVIRKTLSLSTDLLTPGIQVIEK